MKKTITVITNDPKKGKVELLITGMVDRVVTITPKRIRLSGPPDQPVVTNVLIVPEAKYAFRIVRVTAKNGKYIDFSYKEVKTEKGVDGYTLTVRNKTSIKGYYVDTIIIKTTSKYHPEIKLHVHGNIG